jgi:hypothetical protein
VRELFRVQRLCDGYVLAMAAVKRVEAVELMGA